ncbi:ATP-binding protein [Roseicella frigidaeris]|uniref:ATP-binding protein n=1 Tax=Roseicella frigidaeris TaxID=2230885 RepID=A0A327M2N7_9PROT|nr:ATP-binding protein [Roseicella frigidaeris]RAI57551.1 hypothetical protein DOO78_18370 [Roseicella frigidaeris]
MSQTEQVEAELSIGPQALNAYSRLSYTMWYALAEFIDNSTQSRLNYESVIDDVLKEEGTPLVVELTYNRLAREITIKDNSIGMTCDDLIAALRIAHPTNDSKGRSKYGMGMKTAACWIGKQWRITTCEWGSGEEWTAVVDVPSIANNNSKIPLTRRAVGTDEHYTRITITDLHRSIQQRTEENIRGYLGSMYRFDIVDGFLKILYNGEEIPAPDEYDLDTDAQGQPMRLKFDDVPIGGKKVSGWVGVLRRGSGGRKFGGFSLFQNRRQIQGFPNAWKPRTIFGGVDDEGANNLIAQRLTGVINLDGFQVSHTKDAILFEGNEEEDLESFLAKLTKDYRNYAAKRRSEKTQAWSREKVRDLVQTMAKEFSNPEMSDAVANTLLPPLETILASNRKQASSLDPKDIIADFSIGQALNVVVALQERSEYEPYLVIEASAVPGTIYVLVNSLHPYYASLETSDAVDECIRQYIYDAVAEYRVSQLAGRVSPDSVRRLKNELLRVQEVRVGNAAAEAQEAPGLAEADAPPAGA